MLIAAYRRAYPGDSLREIRAMPWYLFRLMLDIAHGSVPDYDEPEPDPIVRMQEWKARWGEKRVPAWRRAFDAAHEDGEA